MEMPFGKHTGTDIEDIDTEYLTWLWDKGIRSGELKDAVRDELTSRGFFVEGAISLEAVKEIYRSLTVKHVGAPREVSLALEEFYEEIKKAGQKRG